MDYDRINFNKPNENLLIKNSLQVILDFLQRHKADGYVILDDYQYDYDSCGLTEYHIKTDAYAGGLTETLANKAIEILNG